jgi:hypothetical protein
MHRPTCQGFSLIAELIEHVIAAGQFSGHLVYEPLLVVADAGVVVECCELVELACIVYLAVAVEVGVGIEACGLAARIPERIGVAVGRLSLRAYLCVSLCPLLLPVDHPRAVESRRAGEENRRHPYHKKRRCVCQKNAAHTHFLISWRSVV